MTKEMYMNQVFNEVKSDIAKAGLELAEQPVTINLSKRLTTALGKCKTTKSGNIYEESEIVIQYGLCDKEFEYDFRNVMMHEYIHAIVPWAGHRGEFKKIGEIVSKAFPHKYNITTYYNGTYQPKQKPDKYVVFCPDCDFEKRYKIQAKPVKYPEKFRCPHCGQVVDSMSIEEYESQW